MATEIGFKLSAAKLMLQAFGEGKSLAEWSRDSRCVVSYNTLVARVKKGWDHEVAITKPARAFRDPVGPARYRLVHFVPDLFEGTKYLIGAFLLWKGQLSWVQVEHLPTEEDLGKVKMRLLDAYLTVLSGRTMETVDQREGNATVKGEWVEIDRRRGDPEVFLRGMLAVWVPE